MKFSKSLFSKGKINFFQNHISYRITNEIFKKSIFYRKNYFFKITFPKGSIMKISKSLFSIGKINFLKIFCKFFKVLIVLD